MPRADDKLPDEGVANPATRQKIIDAAVKCFEQYGPRRTSMADIAEAAGISRKTLYRAYKDRPALVEEILLQRISDMGRRISKRISAFVDFKEALIEGSLLSISAGRKDKLFHEIVQKESNHRMEQFLIGGNEQIFRDMCEIWFPLIDEGRRQGIVKDELSNERIVEIIISLHALLLIRDDYGPAKQRAYLEDVLVPAIMA